MCVGWGGGEKRRRKGRLERDRNEGEKGEKGKGTTQEKATKEEKKAREEAASEVGQKATLSPGHCKGAGLEGEGEGGGLGSSVPTAGGEAPSFAH